MAFDFERAAKEGYTPSEINQYLAEKHGFDYQGALDAGHTDDDILAHLGAKEGADLSPAPSVPYDRGIVGDVISHGARGVAEAGSQVAGAMRLADMNPAEDTGIVAKAGQALQGGIDYARQNWDILKPDQGEVKGEEGIVKRGAMGAIESTPASLVPMAGALAGAAAGSALGPVGTVAGGIIGGGLTLFGTFGLGQYQNTYDETKKQLARKGIIGDEAETIAKDYAVTTAAAEVGGEMAGDLAAFATFGMGKTLFGQPLKAVIKGTLDGSVKNLYKTGAKQFAKEFITDAPFEVGSEMGTAYIEAKKAQELGLSEQTTGEAMGEAVLPAAFMSLIFGGSIHGMDMLKAKNLLDRLNSNDQKARFAAAIEVAGRIKEKTDDENIAMSWLGNVSPLIAAGVEIPINAPIADYASHNIDGVDAQQNARVNAQTSYLRGLNLPTRDLMAMRSNPVEVIDRLGLDPAQMDAMRPMDIDALLDERYAQMNEAHAFQDNGGPLSKAAGQIILSPYDEMDKRALEQDRQRRQTQEQTDKSAAERLVGDYWKDTLKTPAPKEWRADINITAEDAAKYQDAVKAYLQKKNAKMVDETPRVAATIEGQPITEMPDQGEPQPFEDTSAPTPPPDVPELSPAGPTGLTPGPMPPTSPSPPAPNSDIGGWISTVQPTGEVSPSKDETPPVVPPVKEAQEAISDATPVVATETLADDAQITTQTTEQIKASLETKGKVRLGTTKEDSAVISIEYSEAGGHYVRVSQGGIVRELGGGYPARWSKGKAIDQAIEEAEQHIQRHQAKPAQMPGAPPVTPAPAAKPKMALKENAAKAGIEITFPGGSPGMVVTARLKAAGFKWSGRQGLWYAKASPIRRNFATKLHEEMNRATAQESTEAPKGPREIVHPKALAIYESAMAAKDAGKLKEILDPMNKNLRVLFTQDTGIVLPGTIKGASAAIDQWAIREQAPTPIAREKVANVSEVQQEQDASSTQGENAGQGTEVAPPGRQEQQTQTPQSSYEEGYGADNKLVTRDRAEELRRKLKEKLNQLNAGIDPELLSLGTELAVYHVEAGARSFVRFAKAMVKDIGIKAKPYLVSWYMGAKFFPGVDRSTMTPSDQVESFNVDELFEDHVEPTTTQEAANGLRPGSTGTDEGNQPGRASENGGRGDAGPVHEGSGPGLPGPGGLDSQANDRGEPARGLPGESADTQPGEISGQGGVPERPSGVPGELPGAGAEGGRGGETVPGEQAGPTGHRSGRGTDVPELADDVRPRRGPKEKKPTTKPVRSADYRITDTDHLGKGGAKQKARDNIAAIKLLKELQAEQRPATREEQAVLVKYVGWGASELANKMFPVKKYAYGRGYEENIDPAWETLVKELRSLLTNEELAAASASTTNAHYTSQAIISSMYKALERFGFKGGKILEPGSGIGNFIGLLPDKLLSKTRFSAIEMDHISAGIAKALYPSHDIRSMGFEKFKAPNGFFDVALGNPPFSDVKVTDDPDYTSQRFSLHDYFFAKSLDKVRPGGLMVLVTSRYTMDKGNALARQFLAKQADLLGAIRLPQTAFKENAGTDVVTDVLFLRKRLPGEAPAGKAWGDIQKIDTSKGEAYVNEYFANLPEMVLGTHSKDGSMYGPESYTVLPKEGNIEDQFDKAVENLPKDIYAKPKIETASQEEADIATFAPENVKEGAYFLDDNGKILTKQDGVGKAADIPTAQVAKVKRFIQIRDAVRKVLHVQLAKGSDQELAAAQRKLANQYDAFVKEFGPINKETRSSQFRKDKEIETVKYPNWSPFKKDPDAYLVAGTEHYDYDTDVAAKAAIFTKRVISPVVEPKIESIVDALHVTMHQTGEVDMAKIADLMAVTEEQAADGLGDAVFFDPSSQRRVTNDEYLSGNVRKKRADAQAAAEIDGKYKRNVAALEAVQPVDKLPSQITLSLGMPIFDPGHIEQFALAILRARIGVQHLIESGDWSVEKISGQLSPESTSDWGTNRYNGVDLLEAALNSRTVRIYDTVYEGDSKRQVLNKDATTAANAKLQALKQRFASWAWEDARRADTLARRYNDTYNNTVKREYGGDHIHSMQFPGVSSVKPPFEHQKRVAWRIIQKGNTYMAHSVGAGKTIGSILAGMELKRLGIKKKIMWVVPNIMLKQFSAEFLELYPAAKILVADEEQFAKANRNRFMGRVAAENWDGIIITKSAFGLIPMSPEHQSSFIQEQLTEYEQLLQSTNNKIRRKQIERAMKRLQARLTKILSGKKDAGVTFEETGIDQLFVDEAQYYRKLDFVTNQSDLKGVDPQGSQAAQDLYAKSQYLESLYPGRSLVLMSGTPITNTIGELFTIQRFLQGPTLQEMGIHNFDAWASSFADMTSEIVSTPAGYKVESRLGQFKSMDALAALWSEVGDFVHAKDLAYIIRPKVKEGGRQIVPLDQTERQKDYKQILAARIKAIEQRRGPPGKGDDIILTVLTDGRHAAIDDRYIPPMGTAEPGGKLDTVVAKAFEIWERTKADRKTQMIFSDIGVPGSEEKRGFSAYQFMRDELVKKGVPAKEIAFMQDYKGSDAKKKLYKKMNRGEIRILIGSSDAMGVGVNAQERLVALHHVDPDAYLPSKIEQREGRIVRQGNKNKEVELYTYVTRGSYDEQMWQFLESKQRFIDQFLAGQAMTDTTSDVDGGGASAFAQARAMSSDNPLVVEKAAIEHELQRLESLSRAHIDEQRRLAQMKAHAIDQIPKLEQRAEDLKQAIAARVDTAGDSFQMTFSGKAFAERKAAGEAIIPALAIEASRNADWHKIGEIAGGDLMSHTLGAGFAPLLIVQLRIAGIASPDVHFSQEGLANADPVGTVMKLENLARDFDKALRNAEAQIVTQNKTISDAEQRIGKQFEHADALAAKRERIRAIDAELIRQENAADHPDHSHGPDEVMESRGTGPATPQSTVDQVKRYLHKSLSIRGLSNLLKSGKLKIVQTEAELSQAVNVKRDAEGHIMGAYSNGAVYLVADNLTSGNTHGALLHELVHAEIAQNGWKGLLGDNYDMLKKQVERMIAAGHEGLVAAQNKARSAKVSEGNLFEETITYYIQNRTNQVTSLLRRILRAINAWALRKGLRTQIIADDLVGLAESSLRRAENGISARLNPILGENISQAVPAYSIGPVTTEIAMNKAKRLLTPGLGIVKGVKDGAQSLLLPSAKSPEHLAAAVILGKHLGVMHHNQELAITAIKPLSAYFDKAGVFNQNISLNENLGVRFMSDMSQGRPMNPELQAISEKVDALFQNRLEQLEAAGAPLRTVRENYFPGMWTEESRRAFNQAIGEAIEQGEEGEDLATYTDAQKQWVKDRVETLLKTGKGTDKDGLQYLSRRPFKGSESFRKAKVFDDIMTGVDFGLRPISNNPLDLVKLKLSEMDRSIMANSAMGDFKAKGLVKFSPVHEQVAEGWVKINDKYGTVFGPPTVGLHEYVDKNVYDGLMAVAKDMGLDVKRPLSAGRGKLGYAEMPPFKGTIAQFATELSVLAHEIGHQLDFKYDLWTKIVEGAQGYGIKGNITKTATQAQRGLIQKELRTLADLTWEGTTASENYKKKVRKKAEKMAHMLEAYIHAPEKFREVAPNVFTAFDEFVRSVPEISRLSEIKQGLALQELHNEKYVGLPILGYRIVTTPVADILNNYLSSSLYNNQYFGKLYKAHMSVANALNQAQLVGGFHAGFTSLETQITSVAAAIKDVYGLLRGTRTTGQLATTMARVPGAMYTTQRLGGRVIHEWRNPDATISPQMAMIVKAVELAGGGFKMERGLQTEQRTAMVQDWHAGKKFKAALRSPVATLEYIAWPIMEFLVPRQKAGVFAEMAGRIIEQHPGVPLEDLAAEFRSAWNRVDARLGQVRYDRLFMNNEAKNVVQAFVRAPGWTGGTLAEVGGSFKDTAKFLKEWQATGKLPAELPDRVAYTLSLVMTTAVLNVLLTFLFTGEEPEDWKDLMTFKTGGVDEHGNPERFVLPSYMKDLYAYSRAPLTTISHKTHPLLALGGELYRNRDYYGTEIRSEDDAILKQVGQLTGHVVKAFTPFSIRGLQKERERGGNLAAQVAPLVGITPSPAAMNKTKAEALMYEYSADRLPQGSRTKEQAERSRLTNKITVEARRGNIGAAEEAFTEGRDAGLLAHRDLIAAQKKAKYPPFVNSFKKLSYDQAEKVFAVATEEEQEKLRPYMSAKLILHARQMRERGIAVEAGG